MERRGGGKEGGNCEKGLTANTKVLFSRKLHCKNSMVTFTKIYLSCTFALSTLSVEQTRRVCEMRGRVSDRADDCSLVH